MKQLKKDLRAVYKELKALAKKTEKIMKAIDKLEKAQGAGRRKTKAKTTRKAAAKRPAIKKLAELTATDQIVNIIKRAKKGGDVPTLKKKTGFEDKKIRNILMRASKQGKIKRAARGIYVAG
ncbi:MAG: hypothetical protein KAV83_11025 [Desulfobacterales bacterium]|nr:hypothetical protein [Desulfobacterales bacterium]